MTLPQEGVASGSTRARLREMPIAALREETTGNIRTFPGNARYRWDMLELFCLDGQWSRALIQLQAWATLWVSPSSTVTAQLYRTLIATELLRAQVLTGAKSPVLIGGQPAWVMPLVEANRLLNAGDHRGADAARSKAFKQVRPTSGESAATGRFAWLVDTDTRLGPVCEFVVAGCYRWIAFEEIRSINILAPTHLLDALWCPARILTGDGTVLSGYLPSRYPGSEAGSDDVRLGRITTWTDVGETSVIGLGQKTWATDFGEYGVLHLGECRFAQGIQESEHEKS
jgi:type VI secretion system protein ImpE